MEETMKRLKILFLLACALLSASCACTPEPIATVSVSLRGQETSVWCWAASGEMCMDFLGTDVSQCDEANKRFGRTDCCNSCLLYTSDAADERSSVDLGGRR